MAGRWQGDGPFLALVPALSEWLLEFGGFLLVVKVGEDEGCWS